MSAIAAIASISAGIGIGFSIVGAMTLTGHTLAALDPNRTPKHAKERD